MKVKMESKPSRSSREGFIVTAVFSLVICTLVSGHCAKLQAIINRSASDPRAADKPWLVVLDDDTIMR